MNFESKFSESTKTLDIKTSDVLESVRDLSAQSVVSKNGFVEPYLGTTLSRRIEIRYYKF